jgi:prevent-host-death family protein
MARLTVSAVRKALSDTLNRAAFGGERIVIHRHDKDVAVLIGAEDFARLRDLENATYLAVARRAMAESSGEVGWEEVKANIDAKRHL